MMASHLSSHYTAKPFLARGLRKYCGELQKEVKDGKCVLFLRADGSVERVATVVTLKLLSGSHNRILDFSFDGGTEQVTK